MPAGTICANPIYLSSVHKRTNFTNLEIKVKYLEAYSDVGVDYRGGEY